MQTIVTAFGMNNDQESASHLSKSGTMFAERCPERLRSTRRERSARGALHGQVLLSQRPAPLPKGLGAGAPNESSPTRWCRPAWRHGARSESRGRRRLEGATNSGDESPAPGADADRGSRAAHCTNHPAEPGTYDMTVSACEATGESARAYRLGD